MMTLRKIFGLGAGVLAIATAASACVSGSIVLPDSQCDGTQTYCGDGCVDPQTDPRNCGMCGKTCKIAEGEVCTMGTCGKPCPTGTARCGADCVDLQVDRANCGACGTACLFDQACSMGKCALTCQAGFTACPRVTPPVADGGVDASVDGSVDAAATDAALPEGGFDAGVLSKEECVDTKADPQNCGGCGMACPGDKPYCDNGTCKVYTFAGVRSNLDPTTLASAWKECFTGPYTATGNLTTILGTQCTQARLLIGCRAQGQTTLIAAAEGPRAEVTKDTGTGAQSVNVFNGVAWYYNASYSWGFAVANDGVSRNSCDTFTGGQPEKRMCWHTVGGNFSSGYRCGTNFNATTAYERVVMQAP